MLGLQACSVMPDVTHHCFDYIKRNNIQLSRFSDRQTLYSYIKTSHICEVIMCELKIKIAFEEERNPSNSWEFSTLSLTKSTFPLLKKEDLICSKGVINWKYKNKNRKEERAICTY